MQAILRLMIAATLVLSNTMVYADNGGQWNAAMSSAVANRRLGNLELSIDLFTQAGLHARTDQEQKRAAGELGATLLQARHLDQADAPLRSAYAFFAGAERARYAIDLGNLAMLRKRQQDAQRFYEEALVLAGDDAEVRASAGLNLARLVPEPERQQRLSELFGEISGVDSAASRVRLHLNLGNQARKLGKPALALAYRSLDQARRLSGQAAGNRLSIETLDALAQLYEDRDRKEDALRLTQQAIADAHALSPGSVGDLLIDLEWRLGRLYRSLGQEERALVAYQKAVEQIEGLRQDIPIEYEDGRSSFRSTLEPIYLGLADLLLQAADRQPGEGRLAYLRRAMDTVELIKQSELQDYLGDRCSVETIKGGESGVIPAGTAILYPVILRDRIELLLDTETGIVRGSTRIPGRELREAALAFAADLRNGEDDYLPRARQLYDWLLRPFDELIAERHIETLVVVPDGALRLVAIGALHDGKRFAIEKFAITTVTGLSMTNTSSPQTQSVTSLIAGVSEFGPVVDKLSQATVDRIFSPDNGKG
ncbi:MAG: CHAT domain-containing protein, partial [Proteobacteria bacterium]|nr:CHAT domain-containing protein [Pseudomonadota bacterium]